MTQKSLYCAGTTPALRYATQFLEKRGVTVVDSPRWNTGHLLLDVPSFRPGSSLWDEKNLDTLLTSLPWDVTVWGGNLDHPALEGFQCVDLLKDETYLAENAAITANCTLTVAAPLLHTTWAQTPALIIGWGRIGKCLARLLKSMDCPVTVAVRKEADRAALRSLGYRAVEMDEMKESLPLFRLLVNTVPVEVLTAEEAARCKNCVKIDLASKKGIGGEDVVWARGLPGIHAPESSGALIAESFLRLRKEETE